MKKIISDMYPNTFSNVFDSVATSSAGRYRPTCEAALLKMIFTLQAPTLSMSQMFDSSDIQNLAVNNEFFLDIVREGIIRTSLFEPYKSLKEYVLSSLAWNPDVKKRYVFSSLPFLSELDDKEAEQTQNSLRNKLSGLPDHGYPSDVANIYGEVLDTFFRAVTRLEEALGQGGKEGRKGLDNYQNNLTNPKPLSVVVRKIIDRHPEQLEQDPLYQHWKRLVDIACSDKEKMEGRSYYYQIIKEIWGEGKDAQDLAELINISLNISMGSRIATSTRWQVPRRNECAKALISQKTFHSNEFQRHGDELFKTATLQEEITDLTYGDKVEAVNWEKAWHMVKHMGKIMQNIERDPDPEQNRKNVSQKMYEKYCLGVRKEYNVPTELGGSGIRLRNVAIETNDKEKVAVSELKDSEANGRNGVKHVEERMER